MKIKNQQKNKGFTLVELMVATFIFTAIMLASMGALLVTINSARQARALRTSMDNINFAMESMTRSIRMGTNYVCAEEIDMVNNPTLTVDCPEGGTAMAFIPQKPDPKLFRVGYKLTKRLDGSETYTLERGDGATNTWVEIVAPEVNIEKLNFFVNGSDPQDQVQASVYIIIKGEITIKGVSTGFAIQTMASQRNF
jgi:prepilin-type N-terminal cleavage/methylation domain-containing protein